MIIINEMLQLSRRFKRGSFFLSNLFFSLFHVYACESDTQKTFKIAAAAFNDGLISMAKAAQRRSEPLSPGLEFLGRGVLRHDQNIADAARHFSDADQLDFRKNGQLKRLLRPYVSIKSLTEDRLRDILIVSETHALNLNFMLGVIVGLALTKEEESYILIKKPDRPGDLPEISDVSPMPSPPTQRRRSVSHPVTLRNVVIPPSAPAVPPISTSPASSLSSSPPSPVFSPTVHESALISADTSRV